MRMESFGGPSPKKEEKGGSIGRSLRRFGTKAAILAAAAGGTIAGTNKLVDFENSRWHNIEMESAQGSPKVVFAKEFLTSQEASLKQLNNIENVQERNEAAKKYFLEQYPNFLRHYSDIVVNSDANGLNSKSSYSAVDLQILSSIVTKSIQSMNIIGEQNNPDKDLTTLRDQLFSMRGQIEHAYDWSH